MKPLALPCLLALTHALACGGGDPAADEEITEAETPVVACDGDGAPDDTSKECGPGEICRHFDTGESLCADFGAACEDHDECCADCVCIAGGTCVETVFIDYDDIPCETDADCPPAASCITRNWGNKKCAYAGTTSGGSGSGSNASCSSDGACGDCERCVDSECRACGIGPAGFCTC